MRRMSDSGVVWVGDIPVDWNMGRVRNSFCAVKDIVGDRVDEFERLALTLEGVVKRSFDERGGLQPEEFEGYQILRKNELVFKLIDLKNVHTSRIGRCGFDSGIVSPAYIVLREKSGNDTRFAEYYFLALWLNEIFNVLGDDAVRSCLNRTELLGLPYPHLSLTEQLKIANYLDSQCAEIDAAMRDAKQIVEEFKTYKKSLVNEAVTGKNLKGKKVASGQDWLGEIPATWDVRRIVNLYREVSERGDDSLPILSVSINTGVSDKELSDEEQERVFIRSEDKTKYKRVQPGDLTYNMMRAWQGAFGAVRVNGMVSPAYVVARPKVEMDSRYVEYLLRSPNATREMQRYSRGIADFRLRLYWPEFKNIRIPCPPLEEQKRIADMLDEKCGEIDAIIADKELLIADLETYKKSLIFEVVTGKREVA